MGDPRESVRARATLPRRAPRTPLIIQSPGPEPLTILRHFTYQMHRSGLIPIQAEIIVYETNRLRPTELPETPKGSYAPAAEVFGIAARTSSLPAIMTKRIALPMVLQLLVCTSLRAANPSAHQSGRHSATACASASLSTRVSVVVVKLAYLAPFLSILVNPTSSSSKLPRNPRAPLRPSMSRL